MFTQESADSREGPDILAGADQVVVISGANYNAKDRTKNTRLCDERSPSAIEELAALLTDYQPGESRAFMEWPVMSVAFLANRQLIGEVGLLSGEGWVRTLFGGDRAVREPQRLSVWLAARGVDVAPEP